MATLGIIPARGGSKRVPRKNIRLLAGKPLIVHAIETALKASMVDRLIVSTDDEEIAAIGKKYGAEVPFLRPTHLAQDNIPDQPVFQHALEWLKDNDKYEPDIILNLRPTTPFKTAEIIDGVVSRMIETDAEIVRTVNEVIGIEHPYWMFYLSPDGFCTPFIDDLDFKQFYQRQKLPQLYSTNGVVDAYSKAAIKNGNIIYSPKMIGYPIPEENALDIDTEFHFKLCEALLRYLTK